MKKLRIAQIAPLWYSIPPKKYGGSERIISYLTEELVKRGHSVTLFASGDSKTKAKLVSLSKKSLFESNIEWQEYWWHFFNHSVAFENSKNFDIIHCHWPVGGAFFQNFITTPVLTTLHNFIEKNNSILKIFNYYKNNLNLVFISKKQRNIIPIIFKNNWVINNGINLKELKFNKNHKNYLIWVAKIAKSKHIEDAIKIAELTGEKLILAGQIQKHQKNYFKKIIVPKLNNNIKYIGELKQKDFSKFYGSAKACLYPQGLVKIESMACGTPVIVLKEKEEFVNNKKTGFVVKNIAETIKAIKNIDSIDRHECRKWVEENYSLEKMVDEYEKAYYEILKKKKK